MAGFDAIGNQRPWLMVRPVRGQIANEIAPAFFRAWKVIFACLQQGQNRNLNEKGVPYVTLMGAKRRKTGHLFPASPAMTLGKVL